MTHSKNAMLLFSFRKKLNTITSERVTRTGAIVLGSHMFFHALTFSWSGGSCLKTRLIGRVFKHLPRDPASVNAMNKTCVIVILAYFTLFQPNYH